MIFTYNLEGLDTLIQSKDVDYTKLKVWLGEEKSQDSNFKSIPQVLEELKFEQSKIQNELGEADKKYQKYLSDKKIWEDNKSKIIGNQTINESLEYY